VRQGMWGAPSKIWHDGQLAITDPGEAGRTPTYLPTLGSNVKSGRTPAEAIIVRC